MMNNFNIEKIIKIFIALIIIYFIGLRFIPRISRDIFNPTTYEQGFIYMILFLINLIILLLLCKKVKPGSDSYLFQLDIINIINDSFTKLMDLILENINTDKFERLFIKTLRKFKKIPLHILQLVFFGSRIIFFILLFIDVIYFEKFCLSYYGIYLLLFPLLIRGFIELSLYVTGLILKEVTKSVVICKYDNILNGLPMDINDYELTKNNVFYDSVEEALLIADKALEQSDYLYFVKHNLTKYIWYYICIRIFYIFIWGYILYYYPLPIIKTCIIFIYKNLLIYFPQAFFLITLVIAYSLFKNK